MLTLLAFAALQVSDDAVDFSYVDGILGKRSIMIRTPKVRLKPPKFSPKPFGEPPAPWQFDWTTGAYVATGESYRARIEVFSQEAIRSTSRPTSVARLFGQLYSFNAARLRLDHSTEFGNGVVSVYLCFGGKSGGEQLYDIETGPEGERKVNTIYLYDLPSFTDPVEMVREIAHEYGHATLPPVGGYSAPENWSNGLLGEKLYLPYLAAARRKGEISGADTMGATADALDAWTKRNVDPLVASAALNGPRASLLAAKDKPSMDAFLGLALLTARLYGPKTMTRALIANGVLSATTFPAAAATAAEEPETTILDIPPTLRTKPIWIPLGAGRLSGAKILSKKAGWARIQASTGPVVVRGIPR